MAITSLYSSSSWLVGTFLIGTMTLVPDLDDKVEKRIYQLLSTQTFEGQTRENRAELLGYGDKTLPVLEKILSSKQNDRSSEYMKMRSLYLLREIGGSASRLRPLVRRYLLSEKSSLYSNAVEALASIGSNADVPLIFAMLDDPKNTVRYQAVEAMGKLGDDESALLALEIWHKRVITADKLRLYQWLQGLMPKHIEKAKNDIRKRISKKKKTSSARLTEPSEQNAKLEARIRVLLRGASVFLNEEGVNSNWAELMGYGDKALPTLQKILSAPKPQNGKDQAIDSFLKARALSVLSEIGGNAKKLYYLVPRFLLSEKIEVRGNAVAALGFLGSKDDLPALIAMLYDPELITRYRRTFENGTITAGKMNDGSEHTILHQVIASLSKLGKDEVTLLALEIWYQRATQSEKKRRQHWNTSIKNFEKNKNTIKQRIEKKKEAGKE